MTAKTTPAVYGSIAAVMETLSKEGIAKDRKNDAQGYKFRGIDDVYNALAPVLSQHGLIMLPRVLSREVSERETIKEWNGKEKRSVLFYVAVEVEFDLISKEDGSSHTIKTYGEAMDSGDKATNKAMSAAYKYAAMQAFCIPTEGDNDADATTHEVAPRRQETPAPQKTMTLAERAERLISSLQAATDKAALDKAMALGSKLCAELDLADPDLLATVTLAHDVRRDELEANPFDAVAA